MVNVLWREIVARVVDIGGVVDHHYLYILIMIKIISKKKKNHHETYSIYSLIILNVVRIFPLLFKTNINKEHHTKSGCFVP
jgi:hypothetical protein